MATNIVYTKKKNDKRFKFRNKECKIIFRMTFLNEYLTKGKNCQIISCLRNTDIVLDPSSFFFLFLLLLLLLCLLDTHLTYISPVKPLFLFLFSKKKKEKKFHLSSFYHHLLRPSYFLLLTKFCVFQFLHLLFFIAKCNVI